MKSSKQLCGMQKNAFILYRHTHKHKIATFIRNRKKKYTQQLSQLSATLVDDFYVCNETESHKQILLTAAHTHLR